MKKTISILILLIILSLGLVITNCYRVGPGYPRTFHITNDSNKTVHKIFVEYEDNGEIIRGQIAEEFTLIYPGAVSEQVEVSLIDPKRAPLIETLDIVDLYSVSETETFKITLTNVKTFSGPVDDEIPTITDDMWEITQDLD